MLWNHDTNANPFKSSHRNDRYAGAHRIFYLLKLNPTASDQKSMKNVCQFACVTKFLSSLSWTNRKPITLNSNECFNFGDLTTKLMVLCPYSELMLLYNSLGDIFSGSTLHTSSASICDEEQRKEKTRDVKPVCRP